MTQFNDQLLGGLPVPSVKVPQQSRRGQDSNPGKPEFFQAFFPMIIFAFILVIVMECK